MDSPRSATAGGRTALAPQRRPGRLRVAALMRAGAEVIAERGYEATTMAEIAARAEAPIGSLYRFFPNKDALAEALIQRYTEQVDAAFEKIDSRRESSTTAEFADALLASMVELRGETHAAVVALLDARPDGSALRGRLMAAYLAHIVRKLKLRAPRLSTRAAEDMAVALMQNMKAVKSMSAEQNPGVVAELRTMTRLYLASKLGTEGDRDRPAAIRRGLGCARARESPAARRERYRRGALCHDSARRRC